MTQLDLYTDASVVGESYRVVISSDGTQHVRSRIGPAMGAWIGWHDCDPSTRPTIVGQAYLGNLGTQRAEYLALIHGLHAALAYAQTTPKELGRVVISVDNKTVALTMNRVWIARELARQYEAAADAAKRLAALGIEVTVQQVSERDPHHKKAHRLSASAWNQVLFDQSWRPHRVKLPKDLPPQGTSGT